MNDSRRRLAGKLAVVTGASAGIGRATAIALADEGATVVVTGRRQGELQSLADECGVRGGCVRHLAGDITDRRFVAELAAHAGDAEILVNNAGILTYAPLLEMTAAETEAMFGLNVLAAIDVSQRFGRIMVERRRGHIVMMTSTAARTIGPLRAVYGATKHALAAIAKGLRIELKPYGVKVTEIAPGMVDTGIRDRNAHPEALALFKDQTYPPLTAQDVAEAIVYALTTSRTCCPDYIELRPTAA